MTKRVLNHLPDLGKFTSQTANILVVDVSGGFSFRRILTFIDRVFIVNGGLRTDDGNVARRDIGDHECIVFSAVAGESSPSGEERILIACLGCKRNLDDLPFGNRFSGILLYDKLLQLTAVEFNTLGCRLDRDLGCGLRLSLFHHDGVTDTSPCCTPGVTIYCNSARPGNTGPHDLCNAGTLSGDLDKITRVNTEFGHDIIIDSCVSATDIAAVCLLYY